MRYSKYNIVIIGSGISGLYLANKLAENKNLNDGILIVTKENLFSGSSALAQGGIVSVIPEINKCDSVESHIKDTITAGCGLNDINAVKFVSENSSKIAQELIRFGVEFDKNEKKSLNFTLEGAHSHPRILHAGGDSTGRVIEEALVKRIKEKTNVEIYSNTMALELLCDNNNTCKGVIVYNYLNNYHEAIYSSNVVIATGGIGQLYKVTTNPSVSTGDGIALAYNSGAETENMEFVQFHPTALYCKNKQVMPLVSESARGEGAKLVDIKGNYFAKNYHHLADLAPRDVVARAISNQIKLTGAEYVNLDISQIGIEKFKQRFPTITSLCEENGIDLSQGLIPVVPAEHYFMGGIKTDLSGRTTIKNLYAIGECASTGLHGANRLASNSLLECAVFADALCGHLNKNTITPPKKHDEKVQKILEKYLEVNPLEENEIKFINAMFSNLKEIMTDYVGIERSSESLTKALKIIDDIQNKVEKISGESRLKYELLNAIVVSRLIVKSALNRTESIGAHYRSDYQPQEADKINVNKGIVFNYDKILS